MLILQEYVQLDSPAGSRVDWREELELSSEWENVWGAFTPADDHGQLYPNLRAQDLQYNILRHSVTVHAM